MLRVVRAYKPFYFKTERGILKNVAYTGVLRSGDSVSEVFPELAIIEKEQFERVQVLIQGLSKARSLYGSPEQNRRHFPAQWQRVLWPLRWQAVCILTQAQPR